MTVRSCSSALANSSSIGPPASISRASPPGPAATSTCWRANPSSSRARESCAAAYPPPIGETWGGRLCAFRERRRRCEAALEAEEQPAARTEQAGGAGRRRRRAGGGADALDGGGRARPGRGAGTAAAAARQARRPHAHVPRGLRALPGSPEAARTTARRSPQRLLRPGVDVLGAHRDAHGRPGHFVAGGPHVRGDHARGADPPDRRRRHLRARGEEPATEVTVDDLRRWSAATAGSPRARWSRWTPAGAPRPPTRPRSSTACSSPASRHATQWLLDERRIGGIGVDTLSLDNAPGLVRSHLAC